MCIGLERWKNIDLDGPSTEGHMQMTSWHLHKSGLGRSSSHLNISRENVFDDSGENVVISGGDVLLFI